MIIALSGYYGFGNVGDEAILYSIIHSIRKFEPDAEIIVLSGNPKETMKTHQVNAVNRWNFKGIAGALNKADLLISGGGSLFQDKTSQKNVLYYAGIIQLARLFNKPVVIYAQGMGPLDKRMSRAVVKRAIDSSQYVSVRDSASENLLKKIGVKTAIDFVPDPVLALNLDEFQSQWMSGQHFANRKLVVAIRDWNNFKYFAKELAAALDELHKQNCDIILLPMHGEYDHQASLKIKEAMKSPVFIAPHDSSFQEKASIIKESDILIGMRLHALIFASIGNTPFAALSYDPKIDVFSNMVGQAVIGDVSKRNWDRGTIIAAIEDISRNYEAATSEMNKDVALLQRSDDHLAVVINKLLNKNLQ